MIYIGKWCVIKGKAQMIFLTGYLFDKCSDSMLFYCFAIEEMHWFIVYFRDKVLNNSVQLLCNRCQKKHENKKALEFFISASDPSTTLLYSFGFIFSAIFPRSFFVILSAIPFNLVLIFRESKRFLPNHSIKINFVGFPTTHAM